MDRVVYVEPYRLLKGSTHPLSSSPVRIPGFHPGDPGSNPGNGIFF